MSEERVETSIKPVDEEGRMGLFINDKKVPDEELEDALERYMRPVEADESEEWAMVWEDIKARYMKMLKLTSFERFQLLMQESRPYQ